MAETLLLLPDFALIALGALICRCTSLDRPVWDSVERLVYYLLFPVLLFQTIVRHPVPLASMLPLAASGLVVTGAGIAAAYALRAWPGVDAHLHASGAQTAFRFNTYIALALAQRLGAGDGLATMALLVAVCVPLCNVAAVWPLARHGGQRTLLQLLRNPLIIATVAGLLFNAAGLRLAAVVDASAQRIGGAALPLGLMAVGAGLRLRALRAGPGLAAALMAVRHALLPLVAIAIVVALRLPPAQQTIAVAFAAMPTASSAYVLAVRMGGHGAYTAGLVSLSTLIGMFTLPAWLALWSALPH